jgi:hypothetical protein
VGNWRGFLDIPPHIGELSTPFSWETSLACPTLPLCTALSTPFHGELLVRFRQTILLSFFFQHPFRGKHIYVCSLLSTFNTLFVGNRAQLPNFLLLQRLLPSHFFRTKIFLRFI